jgi:hypothetical protein
VVETTGYILNIAKGKIYPAVETAGTQLIFIPE